MKNMRAPIQLETADLVLSMTFLMNYYSKHLKLTRALKLRHRVANR
jgi:hypothetical protein